MRVSLDQAVSLLQQGEVVGVPTETVYGLAAAWQNREAVEKVYALKKRPLNNPLIVHVADVDQIIPYADRLPPSFHRLAEAFWPGPLTMIVPIVSEKIISSVRAGLATVGFRVPSHPLTRELIAKTGPLAMPSANLSGRPSSTAYQHIEEDFGLDFPILDGGSCEAGLESTVLYFCEGEWVIIRLGALSSEDFEVVLGYAPCGMDKAAVPLCPGQLYRHYAPKARLILGKSHPPEDILCVVGFADRMYPGDKKVISWGKSTDAKEVAAHLYETLRLLDRQGIDLAWVDTDFPNDGLWVTIAERLRRAAQGLS